MTTDVRAGPGGFFCRLDVCWPGGSYGRGVDFFQAFLMRNGLIAEICRYDDEESAQEAIGLGC